MSKHDFLSFAFFGLAVYCLCYLIVLIWGKSPPPQP